MEGGASCGTRALEGARAAIPAFTHERVKVDLLHRAAHTHGKGTAALKSGKASRKPLTRSWVDAGMAARAPSNARVPQLAPPSTALTHRHRLDGLCAVRRPPPLQPTQCAGSLNNALDMFPTCLGISVLDMFPSCLGIQLEIF